MTTYYVSRDGSNTSPYDTWAKAATTLNTAVTAATGDGDVIKVDKDHYEEAAAAVTWTAANNIAILSVDKDSSDALTPMDGTAAWVGQSTGTAYNITLTGGYSVFVYGICFRTVASSGGPTMNFGSSSADGANYTFDSCTFWNGSTVTKATGFGTTSTNVNAFLRISDSVFRFGATGSGLFMACRGELINCSIDSGGSIPTTLFLSADHAGDCTVEGCDLSSITGTLVASHAAKAKLYKFANCKLGSGVTVLATQAPANLSSAEAILYNCSSGDIHYSIAHYNALGSTVVSAATYCNDNIADVDLSWYVESTANATFYSPYVSPWIDVYNDDVSTSITPYLEGLRASDSDSACDTVAQDDEIWSEWSEQDTSSYPLATIVSDRMTPLGTAADQTSTKETTDWTIAAANDAYKSTFKLAAPAAFTPNEVGYVRARVCVGIASKGFFIDPQIRGLA